MPSGHISASESNQGLPIACTSQILPTPPSEGNVHSGYFSRPGVATFFAFCLWGVLPVFWKLLDSVDPFELLCQRVIWSFFLLTPFMFFDSRLRELVAFLKNPRNLLGIMCSGLLLACNWYLYIWAITADRVLEASLGYYINPLINIFFGILIFREKGGPATLAAICLATLGVLYQVVNLGHLPIVPLGLGFSFAIYGLLRKILKIQALPGLFVETLIVLPVAMTFIFIEGAQGNSVFFRGDYLVDALLVGAGFITTVPLLLFAYGAKRVRMTTLGILQYVSPSCTFLLGVFAYGEPLTRDSLITFVCIWSALALYTWESVRKR